MGTLAVLDISESGDKIGEKLFELLNARQRQELVQYILSEKKQYGIQDGHYGYSTLLLLNLSYLLACHYAHAGGRKCRIPTCA